MQNINCNQVNAVEMASLINDLSKEWINEETKYLNIIEDQKREIDRLRQSYK